MNGYIYIIKMETGQYKIGRTNNISNRMSYFAIKLPFEFDLIHTFPCNDMADAERQLHAIFATKRIKGELFNLTDEDVTILKSVNNVTKFGEFEKVDQHGNHWGMPELWTQLPEHYCQKYL